jgi:hypothetical protein
LRRTATAASAAVDGGRTEGNEPIGNDVQSALGSPGENAKLDGNINSNTIITTRTTRCAVE